MVCGSQEVQAEAPPPTGDQPFTVTSPSPPACLPACLPAGNITLRSGGHYNGVTLASLNDALNLIGIRVTCPRQALPARFARWPALCHSLAACPALQCILLPSCLPACLPARLPA